MKEKAFQVKLIAFLRKRGAYVVKHSASLYTRSGVPDILCCYKGVFVAFECKSPEYENPAAHVRPEQWVDINAIRDAGGFVYVVNGLEVPTRILNRIDSELETL